jgi:hypothetical protein
MSTSIDIEILEDGTVSVTTGDIGQTHHISADQLLEELGEMLGGNIKIQKREHTFWKNKNVLRGGKIVEQK